MNYAILGDVVTITVVTKLNIQCEILLDLEDFYLLKDSSIGVVYTAGGYYARVSFGARGTSQYLHRYVVKALSDKVVDHKNSNTLDCRKDNLRQITQAENMQNIQKGTGVSLEPSTKRWRVRVKGKHYGYFKLYEDAAIKATEIRGKTLPFSKEASFGGDLDSTEE